jgi:NADH:ubiquinone oxidoreductase subunit 6 (subunit J)
MLTQSISDIEVSNRSVAAPVGLLLSVGLFLVLLQALKGALWHSEEIRELPASTYAIGNAFLGTYVLPFELASIVLLTVLVGAVVLSRKEVRAETEPQ